MKPRVREKIWLGDGEVPAGWRRVEGVEAVIALLRARRVKELSLGGAPVPALQVAQALEQGAFTGTIPRCAVAVRLEDPTERGPVELALAAAGRNWDTVPTRPPEEAPRPSRLRTVAVYAGLHLVGFAVVVGGAELWYLVFHGTHLPQLVHLFGR